MLYGIYCSENMHIPTLNWDISGFVNKDQAIIKQIPIYNTPDFDNILGGYFTT